MCGSSIKLVYGREAELEKTGDIREGGKAVLSIGVLLKTELQLI